VYGIRIISHYADGASGPAEAAHVYTAWRRLVAPLRHAREKTGRRLTTVFSDAAP
jgi:hypothetical protein